MTLSLRTPEKNSRTSYVSRTKSLQPLFLHWPRHNVPAVKNPLCVLLDNRQLTVESPRAVASLDVTSRIGAIPLNGEIAVELFGGLRQDLRLTRHRWESTFYDANS